MALRIGIDTCGIVAAMESNMTSFFWLFALLLGVLALAFVALPFFRSQKIPVKTALIISILLPGLAVGMYLYLGSPNVKSSHPGSMAAGRSDRASTETASQKKVSSVASMIDRLAARLEENPSDGKGWLLLARSYKHVNRLEDAATAYAKAASLGEVDPELAGLGSPNAAIGMSSAQVFGKLSLSARAAEFVRPTDTVFVFARAVGGSGVPAAVLQRPASDLPFDFRLNDSQSMVNGIKLSDFDEVIVTARISRRGDGTEALQGLEAKTVPIAVADSVHIKLFIE